MSATAREKDSDQTKAINVYLFAAREDIDVCQALKKHLVGVIRNSPVPIIVYSDFDIPAGHDIQAYKEKLYKAEIVVALITSDFIANDDCFDRAKKVIKRYNTYQTKLLPVLARNYNWKSSQFKNLPLFPRNEQPINNKQYWNSEDDALTAVAGEVYSAINAFNLRESDEQVNATKTPVPDNSEIVAKIKIFWQQYSQQRKTIGEDQAMTTVTKEIMEVINSYNLREPVSKKQFEIKANWRRRFYLNLIERRVGAYFLDIIVTTLVPVSVFLILIKNGIDVLPKSDNIIGHLLLFGVPVLVLVLICAGFEASKWQGTFGKKILGMQTTDSEGNRIGFWRALWRNCLRFLFGGLWILLILEFIRYFSLCKFEEFADSKKGIEITFNYEIISLLFILTFVIQLIYFWDTKKVMHDVISGTVVGEKLATAET